MRFFCKSLRAERQNWSLDSVRRVCQRDETGCSAFLFFPQRLSFLFTFVFKEWLNSYLSVIQDCNCFLGNSWTSRKDVKKTRLETPERKNIPLLTCKQETLSPCFKKTVYISGLKKVLWTHSVSFHITTLCKRGYLAAAKSVQSELKHRVSPTAIKN